MADRPDRHGGFDPASFCKTLAANVDNERLSDAEFRDMVRNTVPPLQERPATRS